MHAFLSLLDLIDDIKGKGFCVTDNNDYDDDDNFRNKNQERNFCNKLGAG